MLGDLWPGESGVTRDLRHRFQVEIASKDRQAPENDLCRLAEQMEAPVEGRIERLVTKGGGAMTSCQELKPIVKPCSNTPNAERIDTSRRQF